jgi:glycosyltransferase involved in cell wall biosynthesis
MDLWLGKGVYIFPNYKNWRLLRSRSLTYIHDLGFIRYPEFVQPKNLAFLKANIRKWIARSTLILTGSDHSRQEIIDLLKVAPDKVVRIYHGVDRQHYHRRSAAEIERVKNKYGIKDKYLLCIGSLEPRKNLQRLIAAYRNLPAKLAGEYALCLAGGGGWLNEPILADIAAAKDEGFKIVRPEQYVSDDDLPALISGATLLVYPALYEGFGLPPLQAMACGTPVVVSDNSSLPEVVGKAGVTVDAENPADITAKMIELLSSAELRRELSKKGLRQAAGFDWDVSARELAACAKRAVNA